MQIYLPHILRQSRSNFFMNVYFEECFEMKIEDLRKQLGVTALWQQLLFVDKIL